MRANSSQEEAAELYFLDSMKRTSESTSSARSLPIGPVLYVALRILPSRPRRNSEGWIIGRLSSRQAPIRSASSITCRPQASGN